MPKIEPPRSLERYRKAIESERKRYAATVSVCGGTGCHAHECAAVYDAFEREIAARGLAESIELKKTGRHGFCEMGPLVVVWPQDIFYRQVKPEDVPAIMEKSVLGAELVEDLLYHLPGNGRHEPLEDIRG